MDKPKIFVFTASYHPFIGGAEIAIQEVTRRLAHEFDFFIVTARFRRDLPRREIRPEGTVIRLGFGSRFDKWLLPVFSLFYVPPMRRSLIGVLWGVDVGQGSMAAAVIKSFFPRIPFILTLQYGESAERLEKGRWGLNRAGFKVLLRSADYVTAISTYLLDLARRFDYCGPAQVIPNGVDLNKFKIQNAKVKSTSQNSKVIITVSRLVLKNGIDVLIKAVVEIKKSISDIRCNIIGEGEERRNLELEIRNLKLEDNVRLLGQVSHEEIPGYLHNASIFVRPSRSEGMGNAFVEALAAGLPIIGTPVGGIGDIIEDGKTGLFARVDDPRDLAEKIIRLLRDPALAERITAGGQEMVAERFSWDKIADAYKSIFAPNLVWGKRVVIATGLFPPEIGGPATYSKLLADELPERGIGVRVVPFRSVRHLPKILRHIAYFWRVLLASRGADIIFAQDPVSVGLPALIASRVLGKKFILKIVGDYAWEQYQQIQNYSVKSKTVEEFQHERFDAVTESRRAVQKFVARRADRVIVPSEYLKGMALRWGAAPDRIKIVYNAFSPPAAAVSKVEARRKLNIPLDTFIIISAGRLVRWKGFTELIDVMMYIGKEIPLARLYIIGSGPEDATLRTKIKEHNLETIVAMTGGVAHSDLLGYLRAGDLFILNSSYEGFSHTLLEAMAMGIPVMATAVGGNKEIVRDGAQGILYDRGDPETIARMAVSLYTDSDLRRRLAQGAERDLARFGKEEMIRRIIDIFSTV